MVALFRWATLGRLRLVLGLGLIGSALAPGASSAAQAADSHVPTSEEQCRHRGWRNFSQFKSQSECLNFAEANEVVISRVSFRGGPLDPEVVVSGEGFESRPAADPPGGTSNLGKCGPIHGNTGKDYGTKLWLDDRTQLWSAGYLPFVDCMGLIVKHYDDDRIVYRLGSFYKVNYSHRNEFAHGIYKLAEGDQVTINVKGAAFTTTVHYSGD